MNRFARTLLSGILALTFATALAAAPPDLDDRAALEAFVDGVVKPLMLNNNSPSGVVVIAHGGELVLAKGYGFQDVEEQVPVDPFTTLFRPGSVSKLFTWVSVMQLVEQGQLDLDTDVNEYLEDFKIKDSFSRPVTLRDIMTHSAGFEDGALGYLIVEDPERARPLAEAMERYQPMRVNPPGAQTAYSNYATALAGLIVSRTANLPFEDYVRENIFQPLGMSNASFEEPLPPELADQMATSYTVEMGAYAEKPFEIISSFGPAGGESASGADMVRFAQAILNGGSLDGRRILRRETVDQMLTRQFTHDDRLMGMALGFYETDQEGFRVMGHGGDTQWFHSYLGIDAANDLAFFVSFGGPGGSAVRSSLTPALYGEYFPREEAPPVPPEDFAERAARYAGNYGFWRSNFSTIEKITGLGIGVQIVPTKDNTLVLTFSGKAKQYTEVEENLFRETEHGVSLVPGISPRLIAFQENDAGAITGFVMDGLPFMSLRKLPPWAAQGFNFALLGLSMLVFLLVVLRRFYQRRLIADMPATDRAALRAAFLASAANLLVLVAGVIVISIVQDQMFTQIPVLFKLWLVLPIIAFVLGLYLAFRCITVWSGGALASAWARLRYTVITLCALFMCWFYWYWNVLGFQYMT